MMLMTTLEPGGPNTLGKLRMALPSKIAIAAGPKSMPYVSALQSEDYVNLRNVVFPAW